MRGIVRIFMVVLFATPASSQTVEEKLCIFAAAQKLPSITGLSITASRTKAAAIPDAAKILAEGFGNPVRAAEELDRTFGFLSGGLQQAIRSNVARGEPEKAVKELTAALAESVKGSLMVEIDVRAAAQAATFGFMCAWGQETSATAIPMGMSR